MRSHLICPDDGCNIVFLHTQSDFHLLFLTVNWDLCTQRGTPDGTLFIVASETRHETRIWDLEGHPVSSKSPSRVSDQDKQVEKVNKKENDTLSTRSHIDMPVGQIKANRKKLS